MATFTLDQLNNIQGVGLVGFRKDFQQFVFITFPDKSSGAALVSRLSGRIASAWEVGTFNALFSEIKHRYDREGVVEAVVGCATPVRRCFPTCDLLSILD